MIRFYLVPDELNATRPARGPKYFAWPWDPDPPALVSAGDDGNLIRWNLFHYGAEPSILVAANVRDTDDALLAALPDVTKFADDLNQQLGAQLAALQTALEALNLPAQMLTAGTTYRQTVRGIIGIAVVAQCMQGKGFRIFAGGVTLSTTMGSLSAAARQALQDCAVALGYDIASITGASTVRQVLTAIAQQAIPFTVMGIAI